MPKRRDEGSALRRQAPPQQTQEQTRAAVQQLATQRQPAQPARAEEAPEEPARQPEPARVGAPAQQQEEPAAPARQPRPVQFDDDDLDVPDFLK
jgi:cell division protein FtsZ